MGPWIFDRVERRNAIEATLMDPDTAMKQRTFEGDFGFGDKDDAKLAVMMP